MSIAWAVCEIIKHLLFSWFQICVTLITGQGQYLNTRSIIMSDTVTMPSWTMITSMVSEESFARDTHTHTHTRTHGGGFQAQTSLHKMWDMGGRKNICISITLPHKGFEPSPWSSDLDSDSLITEPHTPSCKEIRKIWSGCNCGCESNACYPLECGTCAYSNSSLLSL